MSRLGRIGTSLYQGDVSVDFVGRRKTWYLISLAIVVIAICGLIFRGFNFGIDFRGGEEFDAVISNPSAHVQQVQNAVVNTDIPAAANPVVVASGTDGIRVQTEPLSLDQANVISRAIKNSGATEVNTTLIGPTWGADVAKKALTGLIVFLILVVLFIWAYFREWRMSVAGIVALAHDLVITVGVYALTGFEVTPSTVTGLLTILGYSLYDTVVVFDKVRENTRGIASSTRHTYAEAANLAVNQTLVRSINTSVAALLPVGAILYVGTFQLGSGPLKDLALALFVGMAAGAYSSIFIATPLLAQLKMLEPSMKAQAKRVAARRATAAKQAASSAAGGGPAVVPAAAGQATAPPGPAAPGPATTSRRPAREPQAAREPQPTPPPESEHETPQPERPRVTVTRGSPANRSTSSSAAKRAQPQRQPRSKRGKGR